ncbi:putative mitochondrial protein Pet127 [Elsinoe australis]|uniref:Putative mitochondrial protein Pet127 n=1 Tax=Elsinoe australis TaxID=40998 RepID=A0A4U7B9E0_9PEZI|nr:putative mitochondrial protein Pet127 [Elsinoe australis]
MRLAYVPGRHLSTRAAVLCRSSSLQKLERGRQDARIREIPQHQPLGTLLKSRGYQNDALGKRLARRATGDETGSTSAAYVDDGVNSQLSEDSGNTGGERNERGAAATTASSSGGNVANEDTGSAPAGMEEMDVQPAEEKKEPSAEDLVSRLMSSPSRKAIRSQFPRPRSKGMIPPSTGGMLDLTSASSEKRNDVVTPVEQSQVLPAPAEHAAQPNDDFGISPFLSDGPDSEPRGTVSEHPTSSPYSTKEAKAEVRRAKLARRKEARRKSKEERAAKRAADKVAKSTQETGIITPDTAQETTEKRDATGSRTPDHTSNDSVSQTSGAQGPLATAPSTSKQVSNWISDFITSLKGKPSSKKPDIMSTATAKTEVSPPVEEKAVPDASDKGSVNANNSPDPAGEDEPIDQKSDGDIQGKKRRKRKTSEKSDTSFSEQSRALSRQSAVLPRKVTTRELAEDKLMDARIASNNTHVEEAEVGASGRKARRLRIVKHLSASVEDVAKDSFSKSSQGVSAGPIEGTLLHPNRLSFTALNVEQPPAPKLAHNLDRVLFNRGVYNLQDRYSGVYNFDPYLENIMSVEDFDFDALRTYKTSSEDKTLAAIARENQLRYVGSTSSMTSMLSHFHYLLSNWRELNIDSLSRGFKVSDTKNARNFTEIYKAPTAIFLRWRNGTYAIDADKEFSTPNVLMALGQSLEKMLTQSPSDFERYRKSDPREVPEAERDAPESYHYSKQGSILMRSQLDAHDPRLPGTGIFDVKTRAVLPVRMSSRDHEGMTGYQILSDHGLYESYEREFYDMFRSTFLKYSLQVRMGRMEGIFIAYHNVQEIFGFQFMNLEDMDSVLHGQRDTSLGDQEFRGSLEIVQKILDEATQEYPEKSIRLHFDTRAGVVPIMYVFAEPLEEHEIEAIQKPSDEAVTEYERSLRGDEEEATQSQTKTQPSSQEATPNDTPSTTSTSPSSVETALHSATATHKPLLAWTLTTTNLVNGTRVQRPENLSSADKWEIKYDLRRITTPERAWAFYEVTKGRRRKALEFDDGGNSSSTSAASGPGKGTKAEKSETIDPADAKGATDPDGEGIKGLGLAEAMKRRAAAVGEPKPKVRGPSAGYLSMLRGMSERGKAMREERLRKAEGRRKVVLGSGVSEASSGSTGTEEGMGTEKVDGEEGVESVDDYLAWLNRHQLERR